MPNDAFTFDLSQKFPRLAKAPIVEAVIHWQARAGKRRSPEQLKDILSQEFPTYKRQELMHHVAMMANFSSGESDPVFQKEQGWDGFRLRSDDNRYVIQFTRDGLAFSRTNGYDHWEVFAQDALDAWSKYRAIAEPSEVQRLGVRFINQISVVTSDNIDDYLQEPPTRPKNLRLNEFVYQSTLSVPGHPFNVRVIKVMQPQSPTLQASSGLFLDIDVSTDSALPIDGTELDDALDKLRWLKNRVFFTLVTDKSLELFGGEK